MLERRSHVVQRGTPQDWLEKELGKKKGQMLWNFARGVDDRSFQPLHVRSRLLVCETVPCVCTSLACLADAQVDRNSAELGRSLHREGAGTDPSHHHNVVEVE